MPYSLVFALIAVTVAIVVILELTAISPIRARSLKKKPEKTRSDMVKRETAVRKCAYFLGYLATHPKNRPVPDECFGCKQAAECLNSSSTKQPNYISSD